jgi:16S rRNA (cytosine967-C5)-methyltransferase
VFVGATDEERVALKTFHPTWFVKYCFRLFGRGQTLALLEANMQPPPTYLRVNTLKAGENKILEKLSEEGVRVEKVEQLHYLYKITASKRPITTTATFKEGLIYIQDKSSCFTVEAANPQPSATVLDVCAAPGAKTTYLAQLMRNNGTILSIDYSKRRMSVWKKEVAHMSAEIAQPIIADARSALPFKEEADVLILDPPCTSTGTLGKTPSAKWRLAPRSLDRMSELQWQMLNNCADQVKLEATLIYSTCSITVEENEILIERFLKWHPEFSLAEIRPKIGSSGLRGLEKCQRLYPHIHQCNGVFIAKLSKGRI